MNNLEKIQKTMYVFKILSKVVMILGFVAASLVLIGGIAVLMSDQVPGFDTLQKLLVEYDEQMIERNQLGTGLILECVPIYVSSIICILVYRYFNMELEEGTPFTEAGAKRITRLGIIFIAADFLMAVFSSAVESYALSSRTEDGGSITAGICLILVSMVIRYGAELEQKK